MTSFPLLLSCAPGSMAFFSYNSKISPNIQSPKPKFHLFLHLLSFLSLLPYTHPVYFNFNSFQCNKPNLTYEGDAFCSSNIIQLTKNQIDKPLQFSTGRATYPQSIPLWDPKTQTLTDFTTHFSFIIDTQHGVPNGSGLAFFLVPAGSVLPDKSDGGYLGLFNGTTNVTYTRQNGTVAVEFDTISTAPWDPPYQHVGVDINSIQSVVWETWWSDITNGTRSEAWVSYNSITNSLTVFVKSIYDGFFQYLNLSYVVDLRTVLPENITVGFSGASGNGVEIHNIISWEFNSSLELGSVDVNNSRPEVGGGGAGNSSIPGKVEVVVHGKKLGRWVMGLIVTVGSVVCLLGLVWVFLWRKKSAGRKEEVEMGFDEDLDNDFERGTGPKRFTYNELALATNNFEEKGKLGEGGFGGVYKGFLNDLKIDVAVKKISSGSRQGKKEYAWEVKIISRLGYRNLVKLIGWSHDRGQFLLVYEFMPNGSLDTHLFGGKTSLPWDVRYRIAQGLASAVLYLHEGLEQCVVHRDIKSSNVMLDSDFNAKLGDFGLARFVDHELGLQTTAVAGTRAYMAPECFTTGTASKESDVFSFGVVALEIACGRKPIEPEAEPTKVRMVEWVWDAYGRGRIFDTTDESLNMNFHEEEMERLMVVGLWCAHPDYNSRPTIGQAIKVLNFEAPLPNLPPKMPVPMYFTPPIYESGFSYPTLGVSIGSKSDGSHTIWASTSKSSMSTGSSTPFLLPSQTG